MDQIFFQIWRSDLDHILQHTRQADEELKKKMGSIQRRSIDIGVLYEIQGLESAAQKLGISCEDPSKICAELMKLNMRTTGQTITPALLQLISDFNRLLEDLRKYTEYVEINVAGFRKILKQREKQLSKHPSDRHACTPLSDFRWVDLVSKDMRLLLISAAALRETFYSACEFLKCHCEVGVVPELGSESFTCVQIAKDIKRNTDPVVWMEIRERPDKGT